MSNKSIIDEAIEQMQQKMVDSRETRERGGEYRIGLDASINILENLRDMHKEDIENAFNYGQVDLGMEANQYYNLTYGGNK